MTILVTELKHEHSNAPMTRSDDPRGPGGDSSPLASPRVSYVDPQTHAFVPSASSGNSNASELVCRAERSWASVRVRKRREARGGGRDTGPAERIESGIAIVTVVRLW